MATDITTADLTEKTSIVENDEGLVFDSEDIDVDTSLPKWKKVKMKNHINFQGNVAARLYLNINAF